MVQPAAGTDHRAHPQKAADGGVSHLHSSSGRLIGHGPAPQGHSQGEALGVICWCVFCFLLYRLPLTLSADRKAYAEQFEESSDEEGPEDYIDDEAIEDNSLEKPKKKAPAKKKEPKTKKPAKETAPKAKSARIVSKETVDCE